MEQAKISGIYNFECRDKDGKLKWEERIVENVVATVGRNQLLDDGLDNSTGYMGLISSVSWSAVAAGDTMASHSGWTEASTNAPDYTGTRKTCSWAAASSGAKALSSACSFAPSESGTLKGAFIVFGTGASATKENTSGALLSAGTFTAGDRTVVSGDTVNVSYTITLS